MKKFYTLLFAALFVFAGAADAQVVFSSRFDSWSGSPLNPDDWMGTYSSLEADSVEQETTGPVYGTNAARLINIESGHRRFTTQAISVTDTEVYDVKFWVRGEGEIRTGLHNGSGYQSYNSYVTVNTSTWQMETQTIVASNTSSAAELLISVRNTAGAMHLELDSVVMEVSAAVLPDVSIYDIQYAPTSPFESSYEGQFINTGGIVTAVESGAGYFIQSSGGGSVEWSAIYVYDNVNTPAQGDSVTMTAEVDEFGTSPAAYTELKNVSGFTVVNSGNTLPTAPDLGTNAASAEEYEGVLVRIVNADCTNDAAGFGQWEINDGSGAVLVDDEIFSYTPTLNETYNVRGCMIYLFGEQKIYPRDASDIEVANSIGEHLDAANVDIFPNPANDVIRVALQLDNSEEAEIAVFDLTGSKVKETLANGQSNTIINVEDLPKGVYVLQVRQGSKQHNQRVVKL